MSPPTLGRIVYVFLEPITVPAIVTAVLGDGVIGCTAFIPGAESRSLMDVPYDEGRPNAMQQYRSGTWHWPTVTR
jgi:hypothetical protein